VGLVTGVTKTIDIPGEDAQVVIKRLNHTQLKDAARARQREGIDYMKEMGGELIRAMRSEDKDDAEKTAKRLKDLQDRQESDVSNYDRTQLLKYGIVSWSYPIPPYQETKDGITAGIDELDEPTAKFIAQEIFEFSRPRTAAEAKNG
jgi:hypothetical protein